MTYHNPTHQAAESVCDWLNLAASVPFLLVASPFIVAGCGVADRLEKMNQEGQAIRDRWAAERAAKAAAKPRYYPRKTGINPMFLKK